MTCNVCMCVNVRYLKRKKRRKCGLANKVYVYLPLSGLMPYSLFDIIFYFGCIFSFVLSFSTFSLSIFCTFSNPIGVIFFKLVFPFSLLNYISFMKRDIVSCMCKLHLLNQSHIIFLNLPAFFDTELSDFF